MNSVIQTIEAGFQKSRDQLPAFRPGDTVRVQLRVREGEKERLQAFEGVCIARGKTGIKENFTLRKISYGVGVERTFLLHSPQLATIKLVRRGKVARAKLFYLRGREGKKTRVRDRFMVTREEGAGEAKEA